VQLTGRYKRADVVPEHGHNLCGCKLELRQKLHDHRVEMKPYAVVKGRPIDRDIFRERLIDCGIRLGNNDAISRRHEILLLESSSF